MPNATAWPAGLLLLVPLFAACSSPEPSLESDARPVIEHYATTVHGAYVDSVDAAGELRVAIDALIAGPSADTLSAARMTWITARTPYVRTEAFRFYDGPIDAADTGPEGRINSWPMDEAYIDYVQDDPDAGIIADPEIAITAEMLSALNEQGGETNIATGWHAIEFLLWGQDFSADGPGARSFTDYTDAPHADRRKQYLDVVTDLLITDLTSVERAWVPGSGGYGDDFAVLDVQTALQHMLRGMGALAGAELSGERMNVAYETKSQEDEHSCFSDNTHADILDDFLSIREVYEGTVAGDAGPAIADLVQTRDAELAERIHDRLEDLESSIRTMPKPFDQAILGDDTAPGRVAIAHIIEQLRALADDIVDVAVLFDISLSVEV